MIRYAIVIQDDPELFGYIDCEVTPTRDMILDAVEGEKTHAMIEAIDPERWEFHPVH